MFKQKAHLDIKGKNEKNYHFVCDLDAPLGEIYDVLFIMKEIILKQINENHQKDKVEKKEEAQQPKEEN